LKLENILLDGRGNAKVLFTNFSLIDYCVSYICLSCRWLLCNTKF